MLLTQSGITWAPASIIISMPEPSAPRQMVRGSPSARSGQYLACTSMLAPAEPVQTITRSATMVILAPSSASAVAPVMEPSSPTVREVTFVPSKNSPPIDLYTSKRDSVSWYPMVEVTSECSLAPI